MLRAASVLLPIILLAGCGAAEKDAPARLPEDAAISDALADPIMTDPDLTSQNQAHAAIAVSGPVSSALPPIDRSDDAIAGAKDAAARLLGGTIPPVPAPSPGEFKALRDAVTAAQMAEAAELADARCTKLAEYTARWAAALPEPLQVYPRGAVAEAAGTDAGGCGLRVVHFSTPVAPGDVLAFHFARLRAAGYPVQHGADGDDHVLRGRKGGARYVIYVRKSEDGLTAADIVVAGG
ncbi:MAG: hypothetical protein JF595_02745 [Sphingomonadales bacterium]|nr:hypothetical protein [Sphingomonadales bacterium]